MGNAAFHRWMREWRTPRFPPVEVIPHFSEVMVALLLSEEMMIISARIPPLDEGMSYTQVSAGDKHTVLLRSDGVAVSCSYDGGDIPPLEPLDEEMSYTQVSAGVGYTLLLRSDGHAVACGNIADGQGNIPPLAEGVSYTQVSANGKHILLLRSDGNVVGCGKNTFGQCNIPPPDPENGYIGDRFVNRDLILQLDFLHKDDGILLRCSNLGGQEEVCFALLGSEVALNLHKRIARQLRVSLASLLRLVMPNGELLSSICSANPLVTVAEVSELGVSPVT